MSVKSMLKHRCTINRNTITRVDGKSKPGLTELATGVRCLLQEKRGRIQSEVYGEGLEYDAMCFFLPGQDIQPQAADDQSDQVVMTSPARFSSSKYKVLFVGDEAGQEELLTAYFKRLPKKN